MKFSNITHWFYPSDEGDLFRYGTVPEDLQDVPDEEYLRFQRGEFGSSVELVDGHLCSKDTKVDYAALARNLRNILRKQIDQFVLPTSTINDYLVTEEQKQILIQDSLLLATWPTIEGWPYIGLPTLSDLCQSLITIPVWLYPEQAIITEE